MNTRSRRRLILTILCIWLGASITATLPLSVGLLDIAIYQLPAFVLLRLIPIKTLLLIGLPIAALVAAVSPASYSGFWIEIAAFVAVLGSLDLFAATGKPEDRLEIGCYALLILCFPFYATGLFIFEGIGLIHAMAHAAKFIIPTLLALVLSEILWHGVKRFFGKFVTDIARPEEQPIPTMSSVVILATSSVIAFVLLMLLTLWSSSWASQLDRSVGDETDRFAELLLNSNHQRVAARVQRLEGVVSELNGELRNPHLVSDEQFLHLVVDANTQLSGASSIVLPETLPAALSTADNNVALDVQLERLLYRSKMTGTYDIPNIAHFLQFNDRRYPVHINQLDKNWVFTIDTTPDSWLLQNNLSSGDRVVRSVALSSESAIEAVAPDHLVIVDEFAGGVLWNPQLDSRPWLSRIDAMSNRTIFSRFVSESITRKYPLELSLGRLMRVDIPFWPYFELYSRVLIASAVISTLVLLVTLWAMKIILGRLMTPINALSEALDDFEHERHSRGGGFSSSPIDISTSASTVELRELQQRISGLTSDVSDAQTQLATTVSNYETLLSSMPLGVMGIDETYRLRFCNDAMLQIIGDSAEASFQLRKRAEQLFEQGVLVDEHTINVEGSSPVSLLLAMSPRKNDSGDESGFWLLATDLTKQKETDSQLLQTAKLATLGEMSTGMAHELNQPLNIIKLAVNNMTNSISKGRATNESMMNRIHRIDSAVDRAASIIDHMRAFGRVAGEDFEPFVVSSSIEAAADLVREPMAAKGVDLSVETEVRARVLGNTIQFEQVLINMINNARDAILSHSTSGDIAVTQTLENEHVIVSIQDTGGGIPADVLPHIFEPFYTTKPVGKGTGLGGSISYGIIQDMQGNIWAENVPGGAKISIRLPLILDDPESGVAG